FPSSIQLTSHCYDFPLHVYRYGQDTWQQLQPQARSAASCSEGDTSPISVPPNGQRVIDATAWPQLFSQLGDYRVVATLNQDNVIVYCDFEIIP
ncbi:MAG: hypothetical protein ABI716_03785, partial [Candidatus Saccharibacteria bacterium]